MAENSPTDRYALKSVLQRNMELHDQIAAMPGLAPALAFLRRWQSARLRDSHRDLEEDPGYHRAASFFFDDLYGGGSFHQRDEEITRVYSVMVRLLPNSILALVADAVRLQVLTQEFDIGMAEILVPMVAEGFVLSDYQYASVYRKSSDRPGRKEQVRLIGTVGMALDRVARKPLLHGTLKALHWPAKAAGLGDLQRFLEHGFAAFLSMPDARHFVQTLVDREGRFADRLWNGEDDPFERAG